MSDNPPQETICTYDECDEIKGEQTEQKRKTIESINKSFCKHSFEAVKTKSYPFKQKVEKIFKKSKFRSHLILNVLFRH